MPQPLLPELKNKSNLRFRRSVEKEMLQTKLNQNSLKEELIEDQKHHFNLSPVKQKRNYPVFPDNYYRYPPLEPAKGFSEDKVRKMGGSNPWEPAPPMGYYWNDYYKHLHTTVNPFIHILNKRFFQTPYRNFSNPLKHKPHDIADLNRNVTLIENTKISSRRNLPVSKRNYTNSIEEKENGIKMEKLTQLSNQEDKIPLQIKDIETCNAFANVSGNMNVSSSNVDTNVNESKNS